jgi:anion-transporting  ArsA/GET3 family ATPase
VAGAEIVRDAVTFFQAFEGMEEGFRIRAARVRELLKEDGTSFVLVASPRPDSVDEAVHFAGKLAESDMSVTALVLNRVQPRFADDDQLAQVRQQAGPTAGAALDQLIDNLAGYTAASDREEQAYADLVAKVDPAPVYRVPLLNTDVHDLDGLGSIADLLFAAPVPASAPPEDPPDRER